MVSVAMNGRSCTRLLGGSNASELQRYTKQHFERMVKLHGPASAQHGMFVPAGQATGAAAKGGPPGLCRQRAGDVSSRTLKPLRSGTMKRGSLCSEMA